MIGPKSKAANLSTIEVGVRQFVSQVRVDPKLVQDVGRSARGQHEEEAGGSGGPQEVRALLRPLRPPIPQPEPDQVIIPFYSIKWRKSTS